MSAAGDTALGVVSFSAFGISAAMGPQEFALWAQVLIGAAPAILVAFLIWRIYRLDRQHTNCMANWELTQQQLALAYRAIMNLSARCNMPSEKDFLEGKFTLVPPEEERHGK